MTATGKLMTIAEAEERWPSDLYDDDTLGGMQREIVRKYWEAREEILAASDDPSVVSWVDAVAVELAEGQHMLDEMQREGLRTAFKALMGYDLPETS